MKSKLLLILLWFGSFSFGQNFFRAVTQIKINQNFVPFNNTPTRYTAYQVALSDLKNYIAEAPAYTSQKKSDIRLRMPTPYGFREFNVYTSITLQNLSDTSVRAYRLVGTDNTCSGSLVIAPQGLYIAVYPNGKPAYYLQTANLQNQIVLYEKNDVRANQFTCYTDETLNLPQGKNSQINDQLLRTYRFAVGVTGEYAQYHIQRAINGGIISGSADDVQKKEVVLAAIVTTIDRVNTIYERDFGISLSLVPNEKDVIFLDPNTDPYNNDDIISMLNNNTSVLNNYIGSANYDGGHLFTTYPGGGISRLGIICGNNKSASVTGSSNPLGDAYDVDYVAHEIGHAFGCNHTFANSCSNNRNLSTSVEPGSGSTIMAYAGVCSPNVQQHSDDYFHITSIREAGNFVTNFATCSTNTDTGNHAPQISVVNYGNVYIPKNTAFMLEASATDADNDALTYNWEQIDAVANNNTYNWYPNPNFDNGPLFRSYAPVTTGIRYFPLMANILSGTYRNTWEVLPAVNRSLNFMVTVRDNHAGGGQSPYQYISFQVDANTGPFKITNLETDADWITGETIQITWDVAGTDAGRVNCTSVDILFSTDNGETFEYVVAQNLPNNGTAEFQLPNNIPDTQTGRLMLKAHNNYFFDVAKGNFKVTEGTTENEEKKLKIYPIPASQIINISFTPQNPDQKITISIFDIRGRLLWNKSFENSENFMQKIPVHHFSTGVYFIKIENGNFLKSKEIIIK